jgi:transcriptional regulator with XRE-family HTH domain
MTLLLFSPVKITHGARFTPVEAKVNDRLDFGRYSPVRAGRTHAVRLPSEVPVADRPMPPLAELLNVLFDKRRKPDGRPYSNEDVASAIRAAHGQITQSYIWMLRRGTREDPKISHLKMLADFFEVPSGFFLDPDVFETTMAELSGDPVRDAGESKLDRVMLRRVNEMSPQSRKLVMSMIRHVSELDRATDEAKQDHTDE